MPNPQGLALLITMYVTSSPVHLHSGSRQGRLNEGHFQVDHRLVLAMAELEYLEPCGCLSYVLSEKGRHVAAQPGPRSEQGAVWALSSKHGKKIHNWREYLVLGRFREYESACGLARPEVFQRDRSSGTFCETCLGNSPPRIPGELPDPTTENAREPPI